MSRAAIENESASMTSRRTVLSSNESQRYRKSNETITASEPNIGPER